MADRDGQRARRACPQVRAGHHGRADDRRRTRTPHGWCRRRPPARNRGKQPKGSPPRPWNERAVALKGARYALWKNSETLTVVQARRLEWIAKTDPRLHRAYLLKEGLRHAFAVRGAEGKEALDRWLSWARRSRIPAFVALAREITRYRAEIEASLDHDLSNALIESTNTKIRLLTRIAFGFRSPQALIALAMFSLGSYKPRLPGRIAHT